MLYRGTRLQIQRVQPRDRFHLKLEVSYVVTQEIIRLQQELNVRCMPISKLRFSSIGAVVAKRVIGRVGC